jgi:heat shock protein HslJ
VIVFDSQNHKVSGFDGCNNFNGSYSFEGKLIKGRLLSTQMACPSDEARAVSSTLHRLFDQGAEVITIHFLSAKGLVLLNKEIDAELVLEPTEKFNKINKK